jgi:hypothetical protein
MTANELLNKQLEDCSYQLDKVLEGVAEKDLDFKVTPTAMTIRELVEHLCEVYTAVEEETRGASHSWGSFSIEDKSWQNLKAQLSALRSRALQIVRDAQEDKALLSGSAFLVAHDYYHVGQLATLRLATNPEWDAYSIYNHG